MGCGWSPTPPSDLALVTAIEAINGGAEEGPYSGVHFWERGLSAGYRLTGIGGSDNHNALRPLDETGSVGSPTTVVYATELSTPAILAAIRAGHAFVDLTASKNRLLELAARCDGQTATMGDVLTAPSGNEVEFNAHTAGVEGATMLLLQDGQPLALMKPVAISSADHALAFHWTSDGRRHWFRADVHGPDGKLWLLGNPIYLNWPSAAQRVIAK